MTAFVTEVCDRCGNLRSVCSDPNVTGYPQRSVCYLTAIAQQMHRRTNQMYSHPEPDDPAPHVTDGMEWWTSLHDLTPEDDFFGDADLLRRARGEQSVGDEPQPDQGE